MKEGPPSFSEEHSEDDSAQKMGRRKFLSGMGAGILQGLGMGVAVSLGGNKYIEQEEARNLAKEFTGKEESFFAANKAAIYLLNEMEKKNTDSFQFGDGGETGRVKFLVGFLERHLKSSVGYQYPFRQEILATRLDRTALMQILGWSDQIIRTPSQKPKGPISKTII